VPADTAVPADTPRSARVSRQRALLARAGMLTADLRAQPDYLVIGGKRCGTTSLQQLLSQHPCVRPPHSGKGTHYFDVNHVKGPRWFRAHFPTRAGMAAQSWRAGSHVITGEASPYYSFHPAAMPRIARELPDVRVVMIARDPVERAYSHYRYEVRRGHETLGIHEALDAEHARLAGTERRLLADPTYISQAHIRFSYQARGMYAEQLDRVLAHLPAEQVLAVDFRRLFGDGTDELARVLRFLGLDPTRSTAVPHREQGDGVTVPEDVRERLEAVYAEPNRFLREVHGLDLRP